VPGIALRPCREGAGDPGRFRAFTLPKLYGSIPSLSIDGAANVLLASQVSFRSLNGDIPQKELDLIELSAAEMTQTGTCAATMPRAA
jgi:hypothetical protein